ncbi:ADOP family duplicated permease, partial [Planctomycetota bacterium]
EPERVVQILGRAAQNPRGNLSHADYLDLRQQMDSLSGLATCSRHILRLERETESTDLRHGVVSRNFFTVLGIQPYFGRFFSDADATDLKNTRSAVLSYRAWKQYFGGDPNLVGQSITFRDSTCLVLGIAPPRFDGIVRMFPAQVWTPMEKHEISTNREHRYLAVFGRIKRGVSIEQAQTEADMVFRRLGLKDASSREPLHALVQSLATEQKQERAILSILFMGVVGTIMFLACVNVSNLLLAQAEIRAKEMAIRAALGSSRWRLMRQLMVESLLLASITWAVSILLVYWLICAWPALLPADIANMIAPLARFDWRVLGFAAAVSLVSVFLFGLAPAWHASKPNLLPVIAGKGSSGQKRYRGIQLMIIGQAGIALALVILATVLTRSLRMQFEAQVGFEKKELLLVNLWTDNEKQGRQFHRELKERVQALPGVKQVCYSRNVPFVPWRGGKRKIFLMGGTSTSDRIGRSISYNTVDPSYFQLTGIPLLRGRTFLDHDNKTNTPVMVVNQTMAQRFWPDLDPVGQWIRLRKPDGQAIQIIGVVRDSVLGNVKEESTPYFFLPYAQHYHPSNMLVAECQVRAASLIGPMRKLLVSLGEKPAPSDVNTIAGYIRIRLAGEAFLSKITSLFGVLGLLLASAGLYGVLAYMVSQQTHNIGVRMALGAQRRAVLCLFLRRGLSLVAIGSLIGLPIAVALGFLLEGTLYGVSPMDPLSIAIALIVMVMVALLACYIPARRAAKIDPMEALRYE